MVTREEIREGLKSFFKLCADCGRITFDCDCPECIEGRDIFIKALCEHLHSQGLRLPNGDPLVELEVSGIILGSLHD